MAMTALVGKIKQAVEEFDTTYSSDRELLLNMACERFRRRLEDFNNEPGQTLHIDGFTVGHGVLTLNKNAYFMLQRIIKYLEQQNNISFLQEIYPRLEEVERQTLLSFREKWLPEAVAQIGPEEVRSRIAAAGKCRLHLSEPIMSGWMNTHTIMILNILMAIQGTTTEADRQSLVEDFFNPYIGQFMTQKSMFV